MKTAKQIELNNLQGDYVILSGNVTDKGCLTKPTEDLYRVGETIFTAGQVIGIDGKEIILK